MLKNHEEKDHFDIEEVMEIEELNDSNEIIGEPLNFLNKNNTIIFGFYDKSSNTYFKYKEYKSKNLK